jgi:hypothetical protein
MQTVEREAMPLTTCKLHERCFNRSEVGALKAKPKDESGHENLSPEG